MTDSSLEALMFPIDKLRPDPNNARTHGEDNMQAVVASLKRWGWRSCVVARKRDRRVLSGNARVEAAQALGMTHAPVVWVNGTDDEARDYALVDNRTADLATWDTEAVLAALDGMPADAIEATGFSQDALDSMRAILGAGDATYADDGGDDSAGGGEQPPAMFKVQVYWEPDDQGRYDAALTALRAHYGNDATPSELLLKAVVASAKRA